MYIKEQQQIYLQLFYVLKKYSDLFCFKSYRTIHLCQLPLICLIKNKRRNNKLNKQQQKSKKNTQQKKTNQ